MKRRLKYPLIVEGKYDKATLSNLVEGEILLTDGFHIYKNKEPSGVFVGEERTIVSQTIEKRP